MPAAALALVAAAMTGCKSVSPTPADLASDVKGMIPQMSDQPWAGPGERAQLTSDEPRFDFNQTAFDASWSWAGGERFIDPFWVARKVDRELGREPVRVSGSEHRNLYEFENTVTIVCVNPVVVLIEPRPSRTESPRGSVRRSAFGELISSGSKAIELPGAHRSGTTVSSLDGLKYYAPGQTEEPKPVAVNEDGVGTIDVPWGALEVREDLFSGYYVRAVASQSVASQ